MDFRGGLYAGRYYTKDFYFISWTCSDMVLALAERLIGHNGSWNYAPAILNSIQIDEIGTVN